MWQYMQIITCLNWASMLANRVMNRLSWVSSKSHQQCHGSRFEPCWFMIDIPTGSVSQPHDSWPFICDVGHVWALISKVECRINDGLKLQFVVASFLSTSTENPLTPGRLKDQRDRSRGFFLLLHFWYQTRTVYLVVIGFRPARYCAYVKKINIYIYIHTHAYTLTCTAVYIISIT